MKILWMPETFIIYRRIFDKTLRNRLKGRYTNTPANDCDLANEWWNKFSTLPPDKLEQAKNIIAKNCFTKDTYLCEDEEIMDVLQYYRIMRNEAEV